MLCSLAGQQEEEGSEGDRYLRRSYSANHSWEEWALLPGCAFLCSLPLGTYIEIPPFENH